MLKKIVLAALLLIPVGLMAQEPTKIAYCNSNEIIMAMPETVAMQDSLKKEQDAFLKEAKALEEEYNKKYLLYLQQQDTLMESIKVRRQQELQNLAEAAEIYQQQTGRERIQQVQQNLLLPIQRKISDAIKAVGDENNFLYIMDMVSGSVIYTNPKAVDATPLVKKKLGLK